jgi:hypothetical protein
MVGSVQAALTAVALQGNVADDIVAGIVDNVQSIISMGVSLAGTILIAAILLGIGVAAGRYLDGVVYGWASERDIDDQAQDTPADHLAESEDAVARAVGKLARYIVYLVALLAAVRVLNIPSIQNLISQAVGYVPNVVAATILLVVGFGAGRLLGILVPEPVSDTQLAARFPDTHLGQLLDADGDTVGRLTGRVVEYYVYAVAVYVVAATLAVSPVAELFEAALTYVPWLVGAAAVVLLGAILADYVADVVASVDALEAWADSQLVAGAAQAFVYLFTVVIALSIAGVSGLVLGALLVSVALPVALGLALAVGRGGEEYVASRLSES